MNAAYAIVAFVVVQRLAELIYSARNTRALLERGGIEAGRGHYPLFILLHAAWLVSIFVALPRDPPIHMWALALFVALQGVRIWVVASLGRYWTTRIITVPGAPLVKRGPYRFVRHPNYLVVIGEMAVLPLVFGETQVAAVFSVLNLALLWWRIRVENAALASRRHI